MEQRSSRELDTKWGEKRAEKDGGELCGTSRTTLSMGRAETGAGWPCGSETGQGCRGGCRRGREGRGREWGERRWEAAVWEGATGPRLLGVEKKKVKISGKLKKGRIVECCLVVKSPLGGAFYRPQIPLF